VTESLVAARARDLLFAGRSVMMRRSAPGGRPTCCIARVTGPALEFYKRAVESGHPAWSVRAAVDLAALREEMGDVGGASKLYEWAVNQGDPARSDGANIWARRAATKLEILLTRQGEQAKAPAIYDRVTKGVLAVARQLGADIVVDYSTPGVRPGRCW
jgi:hypothetical protein